MRNLLSLFRKPVVHAQLEAGSSAERQPTSGLVVVSIRVEGDAGAKVKVRVFVGDARTPAIERPVTIEDPAQEFWIAVHGHLLPNGPSQIRLVVVEAGGAELAERTLLVQVRNEGPVAEQVRASLKARGAPLVLDGVVDSGLYDYADPALTAWFDREPEAVEAHLQALADEGRATPNEIEALRHFVDRGFLVAPDLIDADHVRRINAALDDAVARGIEGYEWGSSQRIHNLHQEYDAVRELWLHPGILRMLELIFDNPARPCQSLTYVFGSQQEHHQDTIHLTPFPAGRMCGVWTALEDVKPESGELGVFPGSHRLPRVYMNTVGVPKVRDDDWSTFQSKVVPHWTDLIRSKGFGLEPYRPKAGTVLIWHENLMHMGIPRKDPAISRRSIVGHYFAHGSVVYYDSSGLAGSLYEGEIA